MAGLGNPSQPPAGTAVSIPAAVDLRPRLEAAGITPRQQGGRGTCSVFTVTAALEHALARPGKPAGRLSVEYLNWASNQAVGQAADGGFFSDLWKGFEAWGICNETEMTYGAIFEPDRKPEPKVIGHAKEQASRLRMNWIKPWDIKTGLTEAQLAAIRQTLAKGIPVCSGLRWPEKPRWENDVLRMCPPDQVFDGHSILITGYQPDVSQPGGGTFSFYNSNRPDKPCRLPWGYALAYMNDAMWIGPAE
ncbi:hypothetical protein GCM10023212_20470 [Luteolibacter yonseiensis]